MSTTPPGGPTGPGHTPEPIKPAGAPKGHPGTPKEEPNISNSPFAKMFARSGAVLTQKQLHMMMSSLLKQTLTEIKREDARWKKAMKKLKDEIEGKN